MTAIKRKLSVVDSFYRGFRPFLPFLGNGKNAATGTLVLGSTISHALASTPPLTRISSSRRRRNTKAQRLLRLLPVLLLFLAALLSRYASNKPLWWYFSSSTLSSAMVGKSQSKVAEEEYRSKVAEEEYRGFAEDYNQRFGRVPPEGMHQWLSYATEQKCLTREGYDSIDADLDYFRTVVIEGQRGGKPLVQGEVIQKGAGIARAYAGIRLRDNKLQFVEMAGRPERVYAYERLYREFLEPVREHSPPLDIDFLVSTVDKPPEGSVDFPFPIFSFCKMDYYTEDHPPPPSGEDEDDSGSNAASGSPNPKHTNHPGTPEFADEWRPSSTLLFPAFTEFIRQKEEKWYFPYFVPGSPFAERSNVISWKGSTTGEPLKGPRFRLLEKYPGCKKPLVVGDPSDNGVVWTDFAFTGIWSGQEAYNFKEKYCFAEREKYADHQKNKYVMDVDGVGFTGRFSGLMRSGSLVFKSSRYREWFTDAFRPYEHYIPVNYDFSDLEEKLAWVYSHPKEAEAIVHRARERVERHFRKEDLQCYMYRILLEYSALFG